MQKQKKWIPRLLIGVTVAFFGTVLGGAAGLCAGAGVQCGFGRIPGVHYRHVCAAGVGADDDHGIGRGGGEYDFWPVRCLSLTRYRFFGRRILNTFIDLPLSVSPVIAGLIFILTFGRSSPIYPLLTEAGIRVVYAIPGILLATIFVTFPYISRRSFPFWRLGVPMKKRLRP